jgi:hypothetical protein
VREALENGILILAVVGVLTFLRIVASRHAQSEDGHDVIAYGPAWKWLVRAFWLFPAALLVAAFVGGVDREDRVLAFCVIGGFGAICVGLTLEVFRRRIELTDSGISQRSAWSPSISIAWKDVRDVTVTATSEVVVRSRGAGRMRFPMWLSGMETLAQALDRHLPQIPSAKVAAKRIRAFRV